MDRHTIDEVPFLTRFFRALAEETEIPEIDPKRLTPQGQSNRLLDKNSGENT